MKRTSLVIAAATVALLAGCATTTPKVAKPNTVTSTNPDAAVSALLPTGPNTFTFTQRMGDQSVELTGYIDYTDCSTEATGTVTSPNGTKRYEFVNSGSGEAVRVDGGAWIDVASMEAPLFAMLNPMGLIHFSVEQERGVVCSIGLLDELATVGDAADESTMLNWDLDRIKAFITAQADITSAHFFETQGATSQDIADTTELRRDLFDISIDTFLSNISTAITKSDAATTITFRKVSDPSAAPVSVFTFTPTTRHTVSPVQYKRYYDQLAEEARASGKTFREILAETAQE